MIQNLQDIRIASLVPSLTELVVELGLGRHLVARTGFCIHPAPNLREVPKVGGTKDVNLAKLRRLAPTHVLVNVDENRLDVVPAVQAMGAKLLVTHPRAPDDNLALVAQLVEAFGHLPGVAERGEQLQQALRDELARNREF
ncbi:MAG TPA: helical backbone metal receptor, partial [Rhizobacter sp.]